MTATHATPATAAARTPLLTRVLWLDTIATGGFAIILAAAAAPLADLLALPEPLLRWAGIALLPYAAVLGYLAGRRTRPRAAIWTLIAVNALWAIDSIALLFTGWVDPNPLGTAFVVVQALAVAAIAELQYMGLRRDAA
ncbi:CHASE2 domain-containing sensor protein [Thermocatellispora tengchongensis]|uniref:CHASE2 domain-containing sensor protein n=1 Tax=Thermocatellispora tengchongensis TaxID=1073253 RepID=A0A840NZV3_9ACTN|nr:hypothetical protein [Thermocatellispora tengchongensis]MBB5130700.1 CHASE2 domain-containing sensor protein [Thermocatellispora tengchongensis]